MHGVKFVHSCHVTAKSVFEVCSLHLDRLGKKYMDKFVVLNSDMNILHFLCGSIISA